MVDLSVLDLSQLIRGKSFTVTSQVGKNGYSVRTNSLVDTGANGHAFIDTACAIDIAKFCQAYAYPLKEAGYIKGYDGQTRKSVTHVIFLNLLIDGRRLADIPFLITDLGQHQIILGRK